MKILADKNAVFLRVRNPARITDAIPGAQRVNGHGVLVPHRIDETRVLNNLGISVPSPILHHYHWPGRLTPFGVQRETAAFLTLHHRAFVLNEIGTGKSLAALWAYDFLRNKQKVKSALVIAPLSTLERTWADEVFHHMPHLTSEILHGTRQKRLDALARPADIYVINPDGVHVILEELQAREDIDLVIVDEVSQAARNAQTRRWKSINKLINPKKGTPRMAWGMTGTPIPNQPTDAWAQCKLISPTNVPAMFTRFRDQVMHQVSSFKWVARKGATDRVYAMMQPSVRYTRDECGMDLPECMYETREAEMTTEQKHAYKEMATKLVIEADEGKILAVNEGVKLSKLIQIAAGVVYDMNGHEQLITPKERLKVLSETVAETPHKVIVYVPFKSTINMVAEFLTKEGYTVACVHGGVSSGKRNQIFNDFQNAHDPRILVAQPAAMSHGLTLTEANMIVWYAPVTSNDIYEQANGRITRPGQLNKQLIIHLEGSDVERKTYARLKDKQSLQGVLLDSIRQNRR